MNKYKVTFNSPVGGKFHTYVNGNDLESAMEYLTDHALDEHKSLFPDKEKPDEKAVLMNMDQVFYTEFELIEKAVYDVSGDKQFELFTFPQFLYLDDSDLQKVIAHINNDELLAKALKKDASDVALKFYNNMSRELKLAITVCDEKLGNVTVKESEDSQKQICNIALQLAAENEITLK